MPSSKENADLKLLTFLYKVYGVIGVVMSFQFLFHSVYLFDLFHGFLVYLLPEGAEIPPEVLQLMDTMVFWTCVISFILGETLGVLSLIASQKIKKREDLKFVKFVAFNVMLAIPVGTGLGVYTLFLFRKEAVLAEYANT